MDSNDYLTSIYLASTEVASCAPAVLISLDDDDAHIINKIRERCLARNYRSSRFIGLLRRILLMQRFYLGMATLIQPFDLEAQKCDLRYFKRIVKDELLTDTLHNPRLLPPKSKLLAAHILSELDDRGIVCCVYVGYDEKMASYWRLVALAIAIVGGLGVGLVTRNAQFGLDVGTAILAVLLVIQVALRLRFASRGGCCA